MNAETREQGDALLDAAVLGKRLEDFLQTDVGKYIINRCDTDIEVAVDALKRCAPWRKHRIGQLQCQINALESFKLWFMSAVVDGIRATEVLEDER